MVERYAAVGRGYMAERDYEIAIPGIAWDVAVVSYHLISETAATEELGKVKDAAYSASAALSRLYHRAAVSAPAYKYQLPVHTFVRIS